MEHHLRVGESTIGAGRGVFAVRPIARGEVVETCPMLVADDEQGEALSLGAEVRVVGEKNSVVAWVVNQLAESQSVRETIGELLETAGLRIEPEKEVLATGGPGAFLPGHSHSMQLSIAPRCHTEVFHFDIWIAQHERQQ